MLLSPEPEDKHVGNNKENAPKGGTPNRDGEIHAKRLLLQEKPLTGRGGQEGGSWRTLRVPNRRLGGQSHP